MLFKKHTNEVRQDELLSYYCMIIQRYYGKEDAKVIVNQSLASARTEKEIMDTMKSLYRGVEPYVKVHFLKLREEEHGDITVYNVHTEIVEKPNNVYYAPNFIPRES